jgi:hypothetical protein
MKHFRRSQQIICPKGNGRAAYVQPEGEVPESCPYRQEHSALAS